MSQEMSLIDSTQLKIMTVDEAQREHYKTELAEIQNESKAILAGIKTKEGVDRASAWRLKLRNFIKSIEIGALGIASEMLYRRKKEIDAEIDAYIEPCEKLFKEAKTKMDRWYLDEADKVRITNEKAHAKEIAKAEEKQQQQIQTLMDLGKPKAAMIAAQKPLLVVPPTVQMPEIKNAIWKKKYFVKITDVGEVLKHIAKNPKYHEMIDQEKLVTKLESLAAKMGGNLQEFKGLECFQSPNSVTVGGAK